MQRYCSSNVGICQLRLYYGWFWLAITFHAEQNKPEFWRLRHTNCKLIVTKITVTVTWAVTKKMYLIYNLKLSLLKRYSITGWILKKSLLSKIIKNWDLHFSDTSLEYFVLVLFLVVLITIYVPTCFSSALDNRNLLEFFTPSTFWGWWKMELGRTLWLEMAGGKSIDKINTHYKSDHDLEMIVKVNLGAWGALWCNLLITD